MLRGRTVSKVRQLGNVAKVKNKKGRGMGYRESFRKGGGRNEERDEYGAVENRTE